MDDMVMTGNNLTVMTQVNEFLSSHFKIKDLGTLNFFVGIQVARNEFGIFMHQHKYTADILQEFEHLHSKFQESDSPNLQNAAA